MQTPLKTGASLEAPEKEGEREGMCVLPKLGDVAGDDDDDEKCFGAILTHFGK